MRAKEFIELEKRLLRSLPAGLAIKERMCFISPVRGTLRGFYFDPSRFDRKAFYVYMFFLPLCAPLTDIHLTFGHRIGGSWKVDEPGCEEELTRRMQDEMAFLRDLETPRDVARALEPFASLGNPHCREAFAYSLIQAGDGKAAARALSSLLAGIDTTAPWQPEIASRVSGMQGKLSRRIQEAQEQLSQWESESIQNLGLAEFHQASILSGRTNY